MEGDGVGETELGGDLLDGKAGFAKEALGFVEFQLAKVLAGGEAEVLLEKSAEVAGRVAGAGGESGDGKFVNVGGGPAKDLLEGLGQRVGAPRAGLEPGEDDTEDELELGDAEGFGKGAGGLGGEGDGAHDVAAQARVISGLEKQGATGAALQFGKDGIGAVFQGEVLHGSAGGGRDGLSLERSMTENKEALVAADSGVIPAPADADGAGVNVEDIEVGPDGGADAVPGVEAAIAMEEEADHGEIFYQQISTIINKIAWEYLFYGVRMEKRKHNRQL